jgi:C4-dicarboxylate-binding protein DctP
VRTVLESTLLEVTEWEREQALVLDRQSLDNVVKSGLVQVHQQTEAEKKQWAIALKPVYSEFKNLIGNEMVDYLEEMHTQ